MQLIDTQGTVTPNGELTVRVQVPENIAAGEHRVVVVLDEPVVSKPPLQPLNLPLIHVENWPENLPLRREDLYDDWGR